MAHKKNENWCGCPIRYTMKHFGDKWSFLIIRDMVFGRKRYYHEFLDAGEGISTNILASRLQNLEEEGVISKKKDPEKGSRFIYSLTEKGKGLVPVMLAMIEWGAKYDPDTEAPDSFIKRLKEDPDKLRNELLDKIDQV